MTFGDMRNPPPRPQGHYKVESEPHAKIALAPDNPTPAGHHDHLLPDGELMRDLDVIAGDVAAHDVNVAVVHRAAGQAGQRHFRPQSDLIDDRLDNAEGNGVDAHRVGVVLAAVLIEVRGRDSSHFAQEGRFGLGQHVGVAGYHYLEDDPDAHKL